MSVLQIGTSGWSYDHWAGPFYPQGLAAGDRLQHYAGRFSTVEINTSFYHLPEPETVDHWRDTVPAGFIFSAKASRYVTHMKKLKDPEQTLPPFFERIERLRDRLGPILFQLPPRWHANVGRLQAFLECLDGRHRHAFEFRDPSWNAKPILRLLERHDAAFCIHDLGGTVSPKHLTTDFVYLRLHGPGAAYRGRYDTQTLAGWAGALSTWIRQGRAVYCYFDNDEKGYAAQDALRLKDMLQKD